MMRRSAGFDADEARRQLLKEWQNVTALELTANDYITCRVNSVDLKNRLSDIETDGRDRLHVWLLQIVGASTAPTSMALPCRWRSRPQHHKRTFQPRQIGGVGSGAQDILQCPIAQEETRDRPRPLGLPPRWCGSRIYSERRPRRGHSSAPQPYRPGWRTAASAWDPAHRSP